RTALLRVNGLRGAKHQGLVSPSSRHDRNVAAQLVGRRDTRVGGPPLWCKRSSVKTSMNRLRRVEQAFRPALTEKSFWALAPEVCSGFKLQIADYGNYRF